MHRRLALVLVVVCLWPASGPATAQTVIDFDGLLAAYSAGDHQVVTKTLNSELAFILLRPSMTNAVKQKPLAPGEKPPVWNRQRPALLLEIAIAASLYSKKDVIPALSAGRLMIMGRPTPMDRNPAEDAFETLWHRIAIAVLQRTMMPDAEHVYLDTLERRYRTGPGVAAEQRPLDPRFVLDRAIADEQMAWQAEFAGAGQGSSTRLTTAVKPGDTSRLAKLLTRAITSSDEAAALPEVANEAHVRGAVLRIRMGRFADALDALHRMNLNEADRVQQYWAALLEARALHELKRLPEAERTYREAATIWPEATSPATGLAFVLFDMNRRDDALAAVAAARTTPDGADPWWSYMLADARFLNRWRDALREMLN